MTLIRLLFPGDQNRTFRRRFRIALNGILLAVVLCPTVALLFYWIYTRQKP
jgi:hypothetical protein